MLQVIRFSAQDCSPTDSRGFLMPGISDMSFHNDLLYKKVHMSLFM